MSDKELKVVFAPGCFDSFEGTQEELDDLVKIIQEQIASGDFLENSVEVTEEMFDELSDDEQDVIMQALENCEPQRKLH